MSAALVAPEGLVEFEVGGIQMRIIPDGEGSFVAVADGLAKALGASSTKDLTRTISDEYKGRHIVPTLGGPQKKTTISEPGVYEALARSRSPLAKPIQKKLFEEVLPAIRKTGRYELAPQSLEERSLGLITELAGVVEEQKRLIASQGKTLEAQRPAVIWAAEQEKSSGSWTTAEVVGDSDTALSLGPRLWEVLDAVFFYRPAPSMVNGRRVLGQRRFRRDFVVDGTGVNLIRTRGNHLERITPRWTARGVGRLKAWLRDQERQGRLR